jgi:hypothetical protein
MSGIEILEAAGWKGHHLGVIPLVAHPDLEIA